jgi:hypothetical protein
MLDPNSGWSEVLSSMDSGATGMEMGEKRGGLTMTFSREKLQDSST